MFLFLTLLLMTPMPAQVEKKVGTLSNRKNTNWITETVLKWAPKAGFNKSSDIDVILAMIKKESDFKHLKTPGGAGEIGALQVIPAEKHIKRAVSRYRCTAKEMKKKVFVEHTFSSGKTVKFWYKLCRCSPRKNAKCNLPNIGKFIGNRYKAYTWKTRLFLQHSKRGALATGIYEMAFWRRKYQSYLKKRFWTKFPRWYFNKKDFNISTGYRWWKKIKEELGEYIWVVHYNWGGRICYWKIAKHYPLQIIKYLGKI